METKEKVSVYQIVTDRILALLDKGVAPWHKPWSACGIPHSNAISRKPYRGINAFLLSASGFGSPYWLTFKQAKEAGGNVIAGSKGLPVVFWNWVESKTERTADGKPKKIPFLRYYTVFNAEQVEGIEFPAVKTDRGADFKPLEEAERIAAQMPNSPRLAWGGDRAFYRPSTDSVQMPPKESFESVAAYYSTLFHELTHATGHESRLARKGVCEVAAFGSATYSREELVAEMGAAFLCAFSGIDAHVEQSAAYLKGWIDALKGDEKLVVTAAAQAQRASDFILGNAETEAQS